MQKENASGQTTSHRLRVWFANCVGSLAQMNGKWVAVPPYYRRPKEPFDSGLWKYGRLPVRRTFQDGKR